MNSESLLASGETKRRSAPGQGFKAKIDGKWQDYAPQCNQLLSDAYAAGCPSMRLSIKGQIYKFDFESMVQKNLVTLEVCEMRAPHSSFIKRPTRSSLLDISNLRHPRSKGRKAFRDTFKRQRPVFVVRVPEGAPGTTIRVPHPKKLGKSLAVAVPSEAQVGKPLFIPVPRTEISTKVKYATGGTAVGATGTAVGVAVAHASSSAAGGAAVGGAAAAIGTAATAGLAGVAVVGAVAAAAATVHYASKNPAKAVVIGGLTIGGLALASHVADVGILEASSDVVEGAGDLAEGVVDVVDDAASVAEDVGEAFLDAEDFVDDAADAMLDGIDFIADLF